MARQRQITLGLILLGVVALAAVVFVNRHGLVERYWTWRLESADEEERWKAAEKLRAVGSPRAEEWYIAPAHGEADVGETGTGGEGARADA